MKDDNWELITGDDAHEIEVLNYSSQVNTIEALVRFIIHHAGADENGCGNHPNEMSFRELHRTGTLFLLRAPGEYRKEGVVIATADDTIIHRPPEHETVPSHMATVFDELGSMWVSASAVEIGAFLLWRINWVHPFKNGNGRTARAFCYACVCLKFGFVLPGTATLIELVMQNRAEYQHVLKLADTSYETTGAVDLTAMNSFVERLLREQFSSIPIAPASA
jgi:Fic family protein